MAQSIRTRVGEVFLDTNGFVVIRYNDIAEIDIQDLSEVEDAVLQLSNGQPMYLIIMLGKYSVTTKSARYHLKQQRKSGPLGEAVVARSLPQRVIGNFYARLKGDKFPVRMFGSRERATRWLLELKDRQSTSFQALTA